MNYTGCPAFYARDDLLLIDPSTDLNLGEATCTLPVLLYGIVVGLAFVVLSLVALIRARHVFRRAAAAKATTPTGNTKKKWIALLGVGASIISATSAGLLLVLPFVVHAPFALRIVFGFHTAGFNYLALRWLAKLIKFGTKVITTFVEPKVLRANGVIRFGMAVAILDATVIFALCLQPVSFPVFQVGAVRSVAFSRLRLKRMCYIHIFMPFVCPIFSFSI
jgi:hypothetical protein